MKFIERRIKERKINPRTKIVILYHKNCTDGFTSAWSAWKKFGSRAEYLAVEHNMPPPKGLTKKEIYTVDFTYDIATIRALQKKNIRVTAIDHHVSAEKETKSTFKYSYAVHHSGAGLTWRYFHPKMKVPALVNYVEDTDLWKFSLKNTKEIWAYLDLFDFDFKMWSVLAKELETSRRRAKAMQYGKTILRYKDRMIARIISQNKVKVRFAGHITYAVNSPVFQSQIGNILARAFPPIAIIWNQDNKRVKVSLRSNGKTDVSKIAKRYGGGGHKAAAGFVVPAGKKLPWRKI